MPGATSRAVNVPRWRRAENTAPRAANVRSSAAAMANRVRHARRVSRARPARATKIAKGSRHARHGLRGRTAASPLMLEQEKVRLNPVSKRRAMKVKVGAKAAAGAGAADTVGAIARIARARSPAARPHHYCLPQLVALSPPI